MLRPTVTWTWLGWVVFFFASIFLIHGMGLMLHELGGHALAMTIVGCGVDRLNLTYFGSGSVRPTPCTHCMETRHIPSVPRRYAAGVAGAALGCAITITVLVRV